MEDAIDRREAAIVLLVTVSVFLALVFLLPMFLTTDDSAFYANDMIDLWPGWMDGKPVYIWIGHLIFGFVSFLGVSRPSLVFVFGIYSAFFGSLTGANLYLIYRSIFRERFVGTAAMLLGAFAPIGLSTSLSIAPYAVALFFVSLAIAAWLRKRFLIWSLAWALAICSHASSILLAVVWAASLLASREKNTVRTVAKHLPVILLVCTAFFGWVLTFYRSLAYFITFNMWVTQKDYLGYYYYLEPVNLQWFVNRLQSLIQSNGLVLLAFSTVGAYLICKRRTSQETMLFLWLMPYLIFYLVWPQAGGKFYIFCLAPLSLLAASGIRHLSAKLEQGAVRCHINRFRLGSRQVRLFVGVSLVLVTVLGGLIQGYATVAAARAPPNEYSAAGIAISQWVTQENVSSNVLVISGWEAHFIRFYSPGIKVVGWYGSVFPDTEPRITSLVIETINLAHSNQERVLMTRIWYSQEASSDAEIAFAASVIVHHYRIIEVNSWLLEIL